MAKRTPSTQAQAAREIRKILKGSFPDTKFRVRSCSFAGGNAVDIDWNDGPRRDSVEPLVGKFQYGHFDGMTDMYEYSNSDDSIPQVKFVQCQRNISEEAFQNTLEEIADNFGLSCDPVVEEDWKAKTGRWSDDYVRKELSEKDL